MRENCTSSLCGGRRPAQEQSSAPPPTRHRCGLVHGLLEEGVAKPVRGKAGQEGGCGKTMPEQSSTGSAEEAKQGAETPRARSNWAWVEAEVWTARMLSALENGVTGGK